LAEIGHCWNATNYLDAKSGQFAVLGNAEFTH
jgi:hypothetical protein